MAFGGFIQTAKGRNMLTRAENDIEMKITHIAVGEGFFTGSYNDIERLVQPKFTLPCTTNVISEGLLVEADLTNAELTESYYLRELGVYATDGKTSVLYVYDNAGTDAQLIQSNTSAVGVAKRLRFILTNSADAKIAVSGVGILYVTPDELEQKLAAYAPTESLTALEAALALQGTALAQHTNDDTKHITAADRAAISELQTDLNATENMLVAHAADVVKHVTAGEREAWSGKVGKSTSVAATLTAAGWTGAAAPFTQVLSIAAVTATSANEVLRPLALTEAIRDAWDAAAFADGGQSAGKLTVTAWGEKPTINLPCRIIIRGDL